MSDSEVLDASEDDFCRWFVGGSPPESDAWPRHAFENALRHGPTHGTFEVAWREPSEARPRGMP